MGVVTADEREGGWVDDAPGAGVVSGSGGWFWLEDGSLGALEDCSGACDDCCGGGLGLEVGGGLLELALGVGVSSGVSSGGGDDGVSEGSGSFEVGAAEDALELPVPLGSCLLPW